MIGISTTRREKWPTSIIFNIPLNTVQHARVADLAVHCVVSTSLLQPPNSWLCHQKCAACVAPAANCLISCSDKHQKNNQPTGATAPSFKPSRTIMKPTYIVKFNTLNDKDTWSRIEFTSISKALGFVSLFVKRGSICKIFMK